jgi:hypothetical protein
MLDLESGAIVGFDANYEGFEIAAEKLVKQAISPPPEFDIPSFADPATKKVLVPCTKFPQKSPQSFLEPISPSQTHSRLKNVRDLTASHPTPPYPLVTTEL